MKKLILKSMALILAATGITYAIAERNARNTPRKMPRTVQGIDRSAQSNKSGESAVPLDYEWYIPDDMPAPDGEFNFDMIKFWAGEGSNRAALVIQWNQQEEQNALVFGYRWDGLATGADMIRAVVSAYPRLYGLIQYSNVSSPTDPLGGYTINGFGWDSDNDGEIGLIDTKDNQLYTTPDGLFIHPRGYDPEKGGSSDYDYDDWIALDSDDLWGAGWYISYWSYWVKDDFNSLFSYSGWSASGRVLQDGSWDGWNFSIDMIPRDWKEFVAAPALIPEDAKTKFNYQGICYELTDFSAKRVKLVQADENTAPYSGNIVIPENFVDEDITYTVTEVADHAFDGCKDVISILLPTSVTKLGNYALAGTGIRQLQIEGREDCNTITKMGIGAFAHNANLETPVFPSAIKNIPDSCFFEAGNIRTLDFPKHIETIGASAFEGNAMLTEINIPTSVKNIAENAFNRCDALKKVTALSSFPLVIADNVFGNVSEATLTVPSGFEDDYKTAAGWNKFGNYQTAFIEVNKGDIFKSAGVTYRVTECNEDVNEVCVTYGKFDGKPSKDLIVAANKIEYTGDIVLPESVKYQAKNFKVTAINDSAFWGADKLISVNIQAPVSKIPSYLFYDCSALESVKIPASVTIIDKYAFAYSGITEMTLPEGVTEIADRTFFQATKMKSINIPKTVTKLGIYCFAYCKALEAIEIGDNVTSLGSTMFQNCTSLKSAKLPSNLTTIPSAFFSSCSALESFEIPATVTTISNQAFSGCERLPIKLPAGVTSIGSEAFKNCKQITEFTFPEAVKSIPNYVLNGCSNLTKVNMSKDVTSIGSYAFRDCTSLKKFDIPEKVTTINTYAFSNTAIDSIVIPDGVKVLNTYTFSDCKNLTYVKLPAKLETLYGYVFRNCNLKELVFPSTLKTATAADAISGNNDIRLYFCNTNPGTCGTYTWRINSSTFAPIVVPTETVDIYTGKNYWKKSEISAPELKNISIGTVKAKMSVVKGEEMTITGKISTEYDITGLPEEFLKANNTFVLGKLSAMIDTIPATINKESRTFEAVVPADTKSGVIKFTGIGESEFNVPFEVEFPSPVNTFVDFDKIGYTVGEGELKGAVMISWNDQQRGVDHLVWGVNFNEGATPEQIIESVVEADSRLYRLENGYAYDVMDKGSIKNEYDHTAVDTESMKWRLFSDATPGNGSVIYLTYTSAEETPVAPQYTFCIPEADNLGAWIPDNYNCHMADVTEFPVWLRTGDLGFKYYSVTFNPSRPMEPLTSGANQSKIKDGYAMIEAKLYVKPNEKYDPDFYDLTVSISIMPEKEGEYYYGNDMKMPMSFVAPERPVTKLIDTEVSVTENLNNVALSKLINYEPADATYTDMDLYTFEGVKLDMDYGMNFEQNDAAGYDGWIRKLSVATSAKSKMFEVRSRINPEVRGMLYFNVNPNPVTEVYLEGVENDIIEMTAHDILAMSPAVKPEAASNKTVTMTIENASAENIANAYAVGGARKFTELVTYNPGEFDLVLTSVENANISHRYHVVVKPLDSTLPDDKFENGIFWLNEEWFTHKNGSINYLANPYPESDADITYRAFGAQNDGEGFGATSQYGMIFADKLFVMSKQEIDKGDIRGISGGRVTVADSHTLKRLAQFDDIGGNGRACVGIKSEKAYVGHNAGIRVLTWDSENNFTLSQENIPGIMNNTESSSAEIGSNQALYNKQIGEMVCTGKYVYALQQATGVHVIDTEKDECVYTIADAGVQGIVRDADGNVWFASTLGVTENGKTKLYCIDPADPFAIKRDATVPGTITCSWGSWRATNFFAAQSANILFWTGSSSDLMSSGSTIYRWDTESNPEDIAPLMTMPEQEGMDPGVKRICYASMRYDDRSNVVLLATTTAPSGNYRYNWYNTVDASTGELLNSFPLKPYYWFPALPIFPDKFAPEFEAINPILINFEPSVRNAVSHSFEVKVFDKDATNSDKHISVYVQPESNITQYADVTVDNRIVTLTPKSAGVGSLNLVAESNGRRTIMSIPVTIDQSTSAEMINNNGVLTITGNRVNLKNLEGVEFYIFDTDGHTVSAFSASTDNDYVQLTLKKGIYLLTSADGRHSLKFVIK